MKKSFNDFACFVCLVLTAGLVIITGVLPAIGISLSGSILSALVTIQQIALLIGVAFGALAYSKKKSWMVIVFWIAIVIVILNAFGII